MSLPVLDLSQRFVGTDCSFEVGPLHALCEALVFVTDCLIVLRHELSKIRNILNKFAVVASNGTSSNFC